MGTGKIPAIKERSLNLEYDSRVTVMNSRYERVKRILLVAPEMSPEIEAIKSDLSFYGRVEVITPNFEVPDAYRSG